LSKLRVSVKWSLDNLVVVKIGGSTLGSHDTTLDDLVTLQKKGIIPVVVHGGGNKITEWLKRMGLGANFVRGMRVTDAKTLQVVVAVLAGLVNKELVAAINTRGGKAIGLSGVDGGLIQAKIENHELGYVGEVVKVNPEPIKAVLSAGYIPIVAPVGFRLDNSVNDPVALLNINGDVVASEIAAALKAERLISLTDVPGVRDSGGKFLAKLSAAEARSMIKSGVISEGMIPKVEACLKALTKVPSTQIIDGRSAGALLSAIESGAGGTMIE
jgi:acetylglutamate kinase